MKRISLSLLVAATVALCGSCASPAQSKSADETVAPTSDTQENIELALPTVYDFSATWCGPCRVFSPIFEKVSKEYAHKANFVKVDVDAQPDLAQTYGIRSIPAVVVVDKSNVVLGGRIGLMNEEEFKAFLKSTLDI